MVRPAINGSRATEFCSKSLLYVSGRAELSTNGSVYSLRPTLDRRGRNTGRYAVQHRPVDDSVSLVQPNERCSSVSLERENGLLAQCTHGAFRRSESQVEALIGYIHHRADNTSCTYVSSGALAAVARKTQDDHTQRTTKKTIPTARGEAHTRTHPIIISLPTSAGCVSAAMLAWNAPGCAHTQRRRSAE